MSQAKRRCICQDTQTGDVRTCLSEDSSVTALPCKKQTSPVTDEIRHAQGASGPVNAADASHDGQYTCYECGNVLVHKRKHSRRVNGVDYPVRAHFAHLSVSGCSGESVEHRAAKDVVARGNHPFYIQCRCGKHVNVHVRNRDDTLVQEQPWRTFKLDVGVWRDGAVVGAVEVFRSHALENLKIAAMTEGGLAWIEVCARDVLEAAPGAAIKGVRAAASLCDACSQAVEDAARERARVEVDAVASKLREAAARDHERAAFCREVTRLGIPTEEMGVLQTMFDADIFSKSSFYADKLRPETVQALTGPIDVKAIEDRVAQKWSRMIDKLVVVTKAQHLETAQQKMAKVLAEQAGASSEMAMDLVQSDPADVLTFGKYVGMTLHAVANHDFSYLLFLAGWKPWLGKNKKPAEISEEDRKKYHWRPEFKTRAQVMLKGHCIKCFNGTLEDWKHLCRDCYQNTVESGWDAMGCVKNKRNGNPGTQFRGFFNKTRFDKTE